jgi:hypothetical protein
MSSLSVFGVAVRNLYSFIVEVLGRSSCHRLIPSLLSRWDIRQWSQLYRSEWALITFDDSFNGKTGPLDWSNFPSNRDRDPFSKSASFLTSCTTSTHHSLMIEWARSAFREGKSRMVQRQQQNMGEPSEREHYSLYCWIYLQGSA